MIGDSCCNDGDRERQNETLRDGLQGRQHQCRVERVFAFRELDESNLHELVLFTVDTATLQI